MAGGFFVVNNLDEISTPNYRKHWQVIFDLDNKQKLVYSDIRRFGEIRNIVNFDSYPSLLEIAPEPFERWHFISDYRHADGKTGQMQLHLNVYKQKVQGLWSFD